VLFQRDDERVEAPVVADQERAVGLFCTLDLNFLARHIQWC
jgi:hypothetical protein